MDFADNGQGFDFVIAEKKGGNGLRNLQQRMQEIDGDIHFYNENGTRVSIRFPYFNGENFE